ncbi:fluoride efflux transporter CrcB [Propionicicella superfundia]|uniref:fluoride efflux transporter CrcB n=1 Tax=Propionicicella superfundia TaxID=348582 RepID=UPI0003F91499|nr:fluoride efflux transporter CrcB [Propionicicella superfundia]
MSLFLLGLAGGLGAISRFLVDAFVARHNRLRLPIGTIVVNVSGALLLGILTGWATHAAPGLPAELRLVLGTGFCGGYTTFSTAAVEAMRLGLSGSPDRAVLYAVVTAGGAAAAAFAGLWAGSLLA